MDGTGAGNKFQVSRSHLSQTRLSCVHFSQTGMLTCCYGERPPVTFQSQLTAPPGSTNAILRYLVFAPVGSEKFPVLWRSGAVGLRGICVLVCLALHAVAVLVQSSTATTIPQSLDCFQYMQWVMDSVSSCMSFSYHVNRARHVDSGSCILIGSWHNLLRSTACRCLLELSAY